MKVYLRSDEGHEEQMELVSWVEFSTVRDVVMDFGEDREKFVVPCSGHSTRAITDVLNWCTKLTPARTAAVWDLLHLLQPSKTVLHHWVNQLDRSTYTNVLSRHALEWLWEVDKEWHLADELDKCAQRVRGMITVLTGVTTMSRLHLEWVVVNRYTNATTSANNYLKLLSMEEGSVCEWVTPDGYVCSEKVTPSGLYVHHREALEVLRAMDSRFITHNVITSSVKDLGKDDSLKMMRKYLGEKTSENVATSVYLSCLFPFWTDLLELCTSEEKKDLFRYTARSYGVSAQLVKLLFNVSLACYEEWHSPRGNSLPLASRAHAQKHKGKLMWRLGACLMDSDAYSNELRECVSYSKIDF